jgi:8-oxo-dGTP diphosphatase
MRNTHNAYLLIRATITVANAERLLGGIFMSNTASTNHGADTRRHQLTGDVHLLLRNADGQVLFGRRQNTGFEDGAYHLPAGHLEAGESVVQALTREAKEEVGVTIAPKDVEFAHIMHSASGGGRAAFFFIVRQWEGTPENREPEKCSELAWFPLDALPDHLIDYCRVTLQHIAAGEPFSVYGW